MQDCCPEDVPRVAARGIEVFTRSDLGKSEVARAAPGWVMMFWMLHTCCTNESMAVLTCPTGVGYCLNGAKALRSTEARCGEFERLAGERKQSEASRLLERWMQRANASRVRRASGSHPKGRSEWDELGAAEWVRQETCKWYRTQPHGPTA